MDRSTAGSVFSGLAFMVILALVVAACGGDNLPPEAKDFAIEFLATRHNMANDWAISGVQSVPMDRVTGADEQWCLKVQGISKAHNLDLGKIAGVSRYILSRNGQEYRIEPIISSDDWYLHDCIGW